MESSNLAFLAENGREKFREYQKELELEKPQKEQLKKDIPTHLDDKTHKNIYDDIDVEQDISDPKASLEKVKSQEQDFNQNKQDVDKGLSEKQIQFDENKESTLEKIQMDTGEMDQIMDDRSSDYDLGDTEKIKHKNSDKDTVESPSPADDYE